MSTFKLGESVIEPATRSIRTGDQVSRLRPICWDVLMYLVDHRGEIVDADRLVEVVWQGSVAEAAYVRKAIHEIRAALGDRERQIVKTLPRVGYVIEAEAIEVGDSPEATSNLPDPSLEPMVLERVSSGTYRRISDRLRRKRRRTTS